MTAAGASLGSILHAVAELIEKDVAKARCSVMLLDADGLLRTASGPSMPAGFAAALKDGVPVGIGEGSCGEAVHTRRPVVVADVEQSVTFEKYAKLAVSLGLHACWSVPILGEGQRPLGAFALYYDNPREPQPTDIQKLIGYAQLVAVAVQLDQSARALERAQRFDPVTGLPDRVQLYPALEEAISRCNLEGEWVAVAMIEMRRLRECNEAFGYRGGDELIVKTANRLRDMLGGSGHLFRTGGSGFTVILRDEAGTEPRTLPQRMLEAMAAPLTIAEESFTPSPRIGLAATTHVEASSAALLEAAQVALGQARRASGGTMVLAEHGVPGAAAHRLRLETDLRRGLKAGELVVHYQPQYLLDTGQLIGVEALVRWQHPDRGLLAPGAFLDVIASGNLHHQLRDVVLRQACHDAAAWRSTHPERPLTVAVNLAPQDLHDEHLIGHVEAALADSGLPGELLWLEVTEQAALIDVEAAVVALRRLKRLGLRVAMDDFGTGYSSLSYAGRLPIDCLKVDRSFLHNITESPEHSAVVAAIAGLAEGLGIEVLAEGIETEEQRRLVRDLGCRQGQGYLWSAAVPASAIGDLLAADPVTEPTQTTAAPLTTEHRHSVDEILAAVAHEVRSPLTVLRLQAGLLRTSEDPAVAQAAAMTERQVAAIDGIMSATRDLHDLATGVLPLRRSMVDLGVLAQQTCSDLADTVPNALRVETSPGVLAYADAVRIRQILGNLLSNATKHSPPTADIDVRVGVDGPWARITVRDRGPGVPADKLTLLFRKFGQAGDSQPGLGLGLYISRQLARRHGGDLTYRRAPDSGAIFVLSLHASTASGVS
ncbi:MAG TPA: EAL domain-containing protein [Euzebya sp.]|nr:EAL domain-containing protein [Euzebya sp.]